MKKREILEEKVREWRLAPKLSLDVALERKNGNNFTWEICLENKVGYFHKDLGKV